VLDLKRVTIFKRNFLLGSVLVFVFITIEEGSQHFISTRNCELLDLICNYAGILFFGKLAERIGSGDWFYNNIKT